MITEQSLGPAVDSPGEKNTVLTVADGDGGEVVIRHASGGGCGEERVAAGLHDQLGGEGVCHSGDVPLFFLT
jgi:hypothetical protein